jgi:hypothetical protein
MYVGRDYSYSDVQNMATMTANIQLVDLVFMTFQ